MVFSEKFDSDNVLESITISSGNSEATIRAFGATLVSWKVKKNAIVNGSNDDSFIDLIFTSPKAILHNQASGGKPVRGGIPLVFPQFGPSSVMQQHGFARNIRWTLEEKGENKENGGSVFVAFALSQGEYSKSMWPHSFKLRYTVSLMGKSNEIVTNLKVTNTDGVPFTFQTLFHTYFQVDDVRNSDTVIKGFAKKKFVEFKKENVQETENLSIKGEVDRDYQSIPENKTITLISYPKEKIGCQIVLNKNLPQAVVWNPGEEKAKNMADLGVENFHRFVCIEGGYISAEGVSLKPVENWEAEQILRAISTVSNL